MRAKPAVLPMFAGVCMFLVLGPLPSAAQEYSHARIVRLSFLEGPVTVQRADVTEWAEASVNTPIQEGFKVSTAENGFAEVEFENTSTVRLGQLSLLEFTQLALSPAGGKINRIGLRQGYATFHAMPDKDDVYEVVAGDATLRPYGKTMFRVDIDEGATRIEVFSGSLDVTSPSVSTALTKSKVLEIRQNAEQPFEIANGITKDAWDEWVGQRETAVTEMASRQGSAPYSPAGGPYYGGNDLYDYGNWSYLPGYGYGWIPTVGMGWSPYSMGRWSWYPGFGYTWISYEPWGWMPYHYGSWDFIPGYGWSWFPGSFAMWSPALVSWYQGQGWVGWAPRTRNGSAVNPATCPAGQCGTAVNINTFVNGRPVNPRERIAVDFSQARVVARPDFAPTRAAMLPGMPVTGPYMAAGTQNAVQTSRPAANSQNRGVAKTAIAAPSAVRTPWTGQVGGAAMNRAGGAQSSGIVFDPQQGRYVNNPSAVTPSSAGSGVGQVQQVRPAWNAGTAVAGRTATTSNGGAIDPLPLSRQGNPNPNAAGARGMAVGAIPAMGTTSPSYGVGAAPRGSAPTSAGMQGNSSTRSSGSSARSAPNSVWRSGGGSSSGAASRSSGSSSSGVSGSGSRGGSGGYGGGGSMGGGMGGGGGHIGGGGGGGGTHR